MSIKKKESKDPRFLPVMEEFYSIQGEGFNTGKAAYFLRIGGCDVGCSWCDVKESWNAALHPLTDVDETVKRISMVPADAVVITGGEPLMYDLTYLCDALKKNGCSIFLETSGVYPLSGYFNWICLSPKRNQPPLEEMLQYADELKVIIQEENDFVWAEKNAEKLGEDVLLFLQPEWSKAKQMMPRIVEYILENPKWRISLQSHKYMGIP